MPGAEERPVNLNGLAEHDAQLEREMRATLPIAERVLDPSPGNEKARMSSSEIEDDQLYTELRCGES